ncbi:MAG TPA: DnaA/Hda family protein [Gemmatimonadales bacterium]|nr:DnaA/Hda family protein [Gemmatimonadales bacterium]
MELNQVFRFDTFLVGANNRLAVTAARAVAQTPGTAYNPLFIYSATGLGKTHLLMAIGQQAKQVGPTVVVEYLTLEEFVEAFHAAVAAGQSDAYRNRFVNVDVLLIDDVQFLTHRREMQTELLRLIKQLQDADKQIVLSSDRPPSEIEGLDERLVSGFAGGLIVDIGRPDFETRLAILRRRAEERDAAFGAGVLEAVAAFESANVRELLGTLNRLVAFQAVNEAPLTPESATALLGWEGGEPPAAAIESPPAADEFSDFLSDVTSVLTRQVEEWRRRVAEAIMRWEGEGYRTARLEALLNQEAPVNAESSIRDFEQAIERLRELEAEMTAMDPTGAGHAVFRDPDLVADAEALVQRAREGLSPPPGPSALWTFEEYAGGESNKLALSAARAAGELPGRRYNPLVLVGPAGVGKTHLLHAIGNVLANAPGAIVACLSAQDFLDELVQAIERDRVDPWRARYRRVTALLLDDVHLLAGKERSQEELFHLYNHMAAAERQLVFTLHAPPRAVQALDDRLVSRFEGGLVAELAAPDRELKQALIRRQLTHRAGEPDGDLVDYLAARPADSVRAVLGLVQRVLGAADARGATPSAALARELLEGAAPPTPRTSVSLRASGVVASPVGMVKSREKFVWSWPNPAERLVEDLS